MYLVVRLVVQLLQLLQVVTQQLQQVQANEVFAAFPQTLIDALRAQGFEFYEWPAPPLLGSPVVRLVTAYDMALADVEALLAAIAVRRA